MRVRHSVVVTITRDAESRSALFAPDATEAEVVIDGFGESSSGYAKVAADASFVVPFGAVSDARGFYLEGDVDFALAINGLESLPVRAGPDATSARVFFEGLIESLTVTAIGDLGLTYAVWGDPT